MENVNYLLISVVFIWLLLMGYLVYLHFKLSRLRDILEELEENQNQE